MLASTIIGTGQINIVLHCGFGDESGGPKVETLICLSRDSRVVTHTGGSPLVSVHHLIIFGYRGQPAFEEKYYRIISFG